MLKRLLLLKKVNNSIWFLTLNDLATWGTYMTAWALVGIYFDNKFDWNTPMVIGVATGINFLARGLVQIPFGMLGDSIRKEKDEVLMLMLGNLLMGIPVILFTQVRVEWEFYFLNLLFGIGAALNIVNWRKLFMKSVDRGYEGTEYAIYDTIMSFSIMSVSILGGTIAGINDKYFDLVFVVIGSIMIASNVWAWMIFRKLMKPRAEQTY